MHVAAYTSLRPEQVNSAFQSPGASNRTGLRFHAERSPPKFFLKHLPITLPAAAEVDIQRQSGGSTVVLRLMWGPLPAPFPRALAGAGLLGGVGLVALGSSSVLMLTLAGLLILFPTLALVYQKQGEARLQASLAGLIGSNGFLNTPH